jgi:putative endonuclease
MYCVYIIRSRKKNKIYIGYTQDLQERLKQHNRKCNISTKQSDDWELIYTENFSTRSLAMKREKYLKSGNGRQVVKLKAIV